MGTNKRIVLDANILMRAVLGRKVKPLLEEHYESVQFFAPEVCYQDARKYLPQLFKKKNLEADDAIDALDKLMLLVDTVESSAYSAYEIEAKQRIEIRDIDDWPVVAVALMLNCPVWTEDADFFGTGIATWTSDRVHLYLAPKNGNSL